MTLNEKNVRLFFVRPQNLHGDRFVLDETESKHASNVLRFEVGDMCRAFDGEGKVYEGCIELINSRHVEVVDATCIYSEEKKHEVHIAQAIPQKAKFDWIVEKMTELGVRKIIPLLTERTVPRIAKEKQDKVLSRWKDIALQTAKQSKTLWLPVCEVPIKFAALVATFSSYDVVLIPTPGASRSLNACLAEKSHGETPLRILVCIGPEGGFTDAEILLAGEAGAISCSLGSTILKTDTAAIVSMGCVNQWFMT